MEFLGKNTGVGSHSLLQCIFSTQGKNLCFLNYRTNLYHVTFSSVAQSYPTLCDSMNHSTPGLPVHHQLRELKQTHVHWVSDAIQPSNSVVPFCSWPQSFPACDIRDWQILYLEKDRMEVTVKVSGSFYLLRKVGTKSYSWKLHFFFNSAKYGKSLWLISQSCYQCEANQIFVKLFEVKDKWRY